MKISWNWLSDYVDLSGLKPEQVADALTLAGLEVEDVATIGDEFSPILVGQIESIDPHPDADKLSLCQVTLGAEPVQIVCGAQNMVSGDRVPVIPAGNRLPTGQKIKKGKIRGQLSQGMMCSTQELGLGEEASGLMILPPSAPVGDSIAEYLHLKDVVLDLSITPNRGDCLSYLGVAREVSAHFGRPRSWPGRLGDPTFVSAPSPSDTVAIYLQDSVGCPRYAALLLGPIRIAPSPGWLARRLEAIGQRTVNNVVDVTNYVMFETGQPLHAFDAATLSRDSAGRAQIVVRRAEAGEPFVGIDHVARTLDGDDLVVADGDRAIALAGVVGGLNTEVTETTERLLLECAHFCPRSVRRTAKKFALGTESSHRFERIVDIEGIPRALWRTVELLLATQPTGSEAEDPPTGLVDCYAAPHSPSQVRLRPARCNALLGTDMGADGMIELLQRIDVPAQLSDAGLLHVSPPSFRPDLEREIDLIEEVGRLYGFDNLEATLPTGTLGYPHERRPESEPLLQPIVDNRHLQRLDRLRDRLADAGLLEAVNYTFVAPERIAALGFDRDDPRATPVEVANPLTEDGRVLRTTLLPGLLLNLRHNLAHQ